MTTCCHSLTRATSKSKSSGYILSSIVSLSVVPSKTKKKYEIIIIKIARFARLSKKLWIKAMQIMWWVVTFLMQSLSTGHIDNGGMLLALKFK